MSLNFGFSDFTSDQRFDTYSPTISDLPAINLSVPTYTLPSSQLYSNITIPTSVTQPDSAGWFGGISDWFSDSADSVKGAGKSSWDTVSNWFSTPSNSNQSALQKMATTASAGSSLFSTVSSWFKSDSPTTQKDKQTQASSSGNSFVNAFMSLFAPATASKALNGGVQKVGQTTGDFIGALTKPLIPTLLIILAGLLIFWMILGRLQRG